MNLPLSIVRSFSTDVSLHLDFLHGDLSLVILDRNSPSSGLDPHLAIHLHQDDFISDDTRQR